MRHWLLILVSFLLMLPVHITRSAQACLYAPQISAVSVSPNQTFGNGRSSWPSISGDGRYITFESLASNLTAGDTNGFRDVFVRDTQAGQTTRISNGLNGKESNGHSFAHTLSPDGRYILFESWASNLTSGDRDNVWDVFLVDRQAAQTTRLSVDTNGLQGNEQSTSPSISGDGRYVVFDSRASNLVGGDTNSYSDIFVYDRILNQLRLVSIPPDHSPSNGHSIHPSISRDGRYIAYISLASNLISGDSNSLADIFVYHLQSGYTIRIPMASDIQAIDESLTYLSLSSDGRYVAFATETNTLVPDDTNGISDIFVYEQQTGLIKRASVTSESGQANGASTRPRLSADGRYLVFQSLAANLVSGDNNNTWDIFARDLQTDQIIRVSAAQNCSSANGASYFPDLSADGKVVVFTSEATNLVTGLSAACNRGNCADIYTASIQFPPLVINPPNIAPQPNFFPGDVVLTWNRVSWAIQYHIEVYTNQDLTGDPAADRTVSGDTLELPLPDLDPHTYYWRIQAQRADGKWSGWSRTESFTVGL